MGFRARLLCRAFFTGAAGTVFHRLLRAVVRRAALTGQLHAEGLRIVLFRQSVHGVLLSDFSAFGANAPLFRRGQAKCPARRR